MSKIIDKKDVSKIILALSTDIVIRKSKDIKKNTYDTYRKRYIAKCIELINCLTSAHIKWIVDLIDKKTGLDLVREIYAKNTDVGNVMYNLFAVLSELKNIKYRREKAIYYKKIDYINV